MSVTDQRRVRKALQGLEYPATKRDILTYVRERGADPATEQAVRAIPDVTYGSADDVEQAVPQRPEDVADE